MKDLRYWLKVPENEEKLARVWLGEDYEVEEYKYAGEPLFYVEIPDGEDEQRFYYLKRDLEGKVTLDRHFPDEKLNYMYKLAEKEIKSVDERFWAFAKPVED